MQFVHPNVLYALLLLLIPVIVHLFQLRRFQKVEFTNVAFLRKVTLQTRKSSQLKKWLILLTRLLGLAALVLAFAQPYTTNADQSKSGTETVIYLDNSFSMQAKGSGGSLMERSAQLLYQTEIDSDRLHWFSNDRDHFDVNRETFRQGLMELGYSYQRTDPSLVYLRAARLFSNDPDTDKRLIWISDFTQLPPSPPSEISTEVNLVHLRPENRANLSIDSLYLESEGSGSVRLHVEVSAINYDNQTVSLSIFDQDRLLTKSAVELSPTENENGRRNGAIYFDLENGRFLKGRVLLSDPNITYDNVMHFALQPRATIRVLSINQADDQYLYRLFRGDEFDYLSQQAGNLNYSTISTQNLIVLNELSEITPPLRAAISAFVDDGGSLLVIPPENANQDSYNPLLQRLGLGVLQDWSPLQREIAGIRFQHPLYKNVFEREVVNFQYPGVKGSYNVLSDSNIALEFEDQTPFLLQKGKAYLMTAPLNQELSDMQSSPLIVPTLYNMAMLSLPIPKLYYQVGKRNVVGIDLGLGQDEILQLRDSLSSFIPLQVARSNTVEIITEDEPSFPGTYELTKQDSLTGLLSYNYVRDQGGMQYPDIPENEGWTVFENLETAFDSLSEARMERGYWKWFVTFAVFMLLVEMCILKFVR